MDLNNRRTGKHGTKPRALALLGHSDLVVLYFLLVQALISKTQSFPSFQNKDMHNVASTL